MAHTPGPWEVSPGFTTHTGMRQFFSLSGTSLFEMRNANGLPFSSQEDDANLIEAAPDLLEACKRAIEMLGHMSAEEFEDDGSIKLAAILDDAVSKAERGEES